MHFGILGNLIAMFALVWAVTALIYFCLISLRSWPSRWRQLWQALAGTQIISDRVPQVNRRSAMLSPHARSNLAKTVRWADDIFESDSEYDVASERQRVSKRRRWQSPSPER